MCRATLNLGICGTCQNVDLFMSASNFCKRAEGTPGDVCRGIELHHNQAVSVRDQLPKGECRVCKLLKNGTPGYRPDCQRPMRGSPVEPMIEYFILLRHNPDGHPGPAGQNADEDNAYTGRAQPPAGGRPAYEEDDEPPHNPRFASGAGGYPGNSQRNHGPRGHAPGPFGRDESSDGFYGDDYRAHSPGPFGDDHGPFSPRSAGDYPGPGGPGGPSPYGPGYPRSSGFPGASGRPDFRGGPGGPGYPPYGQGRR